MIRVREGQQEPVNEPELEPGSTAYQAPLKIVPAKVGEAEGAGVGKIDGCGVGTAVGSASIIQNVFVEAPETVLALTPAKPYWVENMLTE
jgi:hypothetical protein